MVFACKWIKEWKQLLCLFHVFKNGYVIQALMIDREINYGKFITDEASEDAGFFEWAEREK
jgi:hypothetical protein